MNNTQTNNNAFVVGVLKEKKIAFKKSKSGKQMANGHLILVVDTPAGKSEIKVRVMQFELKKDGTNNSLYKALQTVENEFKSIATVGVELADTIRVEGSLSDETYYSVPKQDFIEKLEIKGTFLNRVEKETAHKCVVGFEGYISNILPVGAELEVEIIGIGYEGVAVPVTGIIQQELIGAFQGRYVVGSTTTLNFSIINEVETRAVQTEVGFGGELGEVIETTKTKRIIFGGAGVKYQGSEGARSAEEIKQGIAIRLANLEKKKAEAIANAQNSNENMSTGFQGGVMPNNGAPNGAFAGGAMPNVTFSGVSSNMPIGGFAK